MAWLIKELKRRQDEVMGGLESTLTVGFDTPTANTYKSLIKDVGKAIEKIRVKVAKTRV
jgi:hypothetical protein